MIELRDAIHEGDGDRTVRAWKFMLLYFRFGRHTNYASEAFQLQAMVNATATPREAHQLKWSRVVNVHGGTGRNMPVDLHNEHLNRVLKDSVGDMGANLSEGAIVQRSKSLKVVMDIVHTFDVNTNLHAVSTDHTVSSSRKDEDVVLAELLKSQVFDYIPGRKQIVCKHFTQCIRTYQCIKVLSVAQGREGQNCEVPKSAEDVLLNEK